METAHQYEKMGATIVKEITLPEHRIMLLLLTTSSPRAEASSNLARFDGVKYGYRTPELYQPRTRCMKTPAAKASAKRSSGGSCWAPSCCSSGYYDAYYKKAKFTQKLMQGMFREAFQKAAT